MNTTTLVGILLVALGCFQSSGAAVLQTDASSIVKVSRTAIRDDIYSLLSAKMQAEYEGEEGRVDFFRVRI